MNLEKQQKWQNPEHEGLKFLYEKFNVLCTMQSYLGGIRLGGWCFFFHIQYKNKFSYN